MKNKKTIYLCGPENRLIRFGMDLEERRRFGVLLEEENGTDPIQ